MPKRAKKTLSPFRIGTSGWIYQHWRGVFYPDDLPQSRWFEHYQRHFDTVEINNTFYQLPAPSTFEAWDKAASSGFLYAVKANRFLTHLKKLGGGKVPLQRFLDSAKLLGGHLGPILYQLPPRWKFNAERLRCFLELLPKRMTHVFEFRDPSWLQDECFGLLEQFEASLCIHDLLPKHPRTITGSVTYVRFHGAGERYGGDYPKSQLRRWADWMRQTAERGCQVYAYFNNDVGGHAVFNAHTLRELLES